MAVVLLQLAPMQWHICKQYLATSIPIIIYVANDGKLHLKDYTYSPKECLDGCVHPPVAVVFLDFHKLHQSNYFLQYFFKMSWLGILFHLFHQGNNTQSEWLRQFNLYTISFWMMNHVSKRFFDWLCLISSASLIMKGVLCHCSCPHAGTPFTNINFIY